MGAPNASGLTRIALKLKDRFAAKVHNHSAGDLTSGTLGVSRGGTGKDSHTSNAVLTGNGTNAVNDVATASGALYATGVNGSPQFGTLPVAQGGTGADTAAGARTNLDAAQSDGASGTLALAETAIGNLGSSIATVEQTTATANHAAGDYFMLGNVLMRATSAIATGEQITTSNAVPATLQGQIDTLRDSVDSRWNSLNRMGSTAFGGHIIQAANRDGCAIQIIHRPSGVWVMSFKDESGVWYEHQV